MYRFLPVVCLSLVLLGSPARAGMEAGRQAYDAGDYAGALAQWQPLATAGEPAAQYWLGRLYDGGQGVKADPAKALIWFTKAADQGMAEAQRVLRETSPWLEESLLVSSSAGQWV